jgi:sec-independent protein translocase protein TatB
MDSYPGASGSRRYGYLTDAGARLVFDLSFLKLLVLGVLALVIFGPDQLPKLASQAGRALRDLRRLADSARADLQDGLGPEFRDFDLNDLNPRNFVRKHLWDELDDGDDAGNGTRSPQVPEPMLLSPGESPPYDVEAT